jgi:choline dehydrogenase-like flavoprotein
MGAVTDASGHVLGVDGLMVADASVMPAVPRATTNLPTVVVAERIVAGLTGAS